jgi:hypothetical protein
MLRPMSTLRAAASEANSLDDQEMMSVHTFAFTFLTTRRT